MDKDARQKDEPKPDLLELWMGESEESAETTSRSPWWRPILLLLLATALAVILAKYAVDVLVVLLVMAVAALVLRIIESHLVESGSFTLGTVAIFLCGAAVLGYLLIAPSGAYEFMAQHVPAPITAFFAWSENHGWGHTALAREPGSDLTAPGPASTPAPEAASSTPRSATPPAASPSLALTVSSSSSMQGEPVYLTARLSGALDESSPSASVRFRDGSTVLGAANVRLEGRSLVATLAVRGLSEGRHELTAELIGTLGVASVTSHPVVYVVTAAGR
jgi:hypothetical protein